MAEDQQNASREVVERVRANVVPCAIGAVLLLYFGFDRLSEPTGTGLFERANFVFYYAVRSGGVCMAIVAAWSLGGHRTALLADAAVSCPLGIAFLLTGPTMLIGGGDTLNGGLITLFGGMFVSDGLRNGRAFLRFRSLVAEASSLARPAVVDVPEIGMSEAPSSQRPMTAEKPTPKPMDPRIESAPPVKHDATAGGYLAAFAKKPPETRGDVGSTSHGI